MYYATYPILGSRTDSFIGILAEISLWSEHIGWMGRPEVYIPVTNMLKSIYVPVLLQLED